MHPYSSSSSYVGLLTSQTENVQQGNFPYESFPSSMNIGASDIPPFSSQQSQAPAVEEETSAPTASGEKRKTGEESGQSSSVNVDDHEIRPEGIKAAKARRNNASGKALLDYKSIWEIKKDELAMNEKLSKLAILDTLLVKKESLTEAEEVVKNKLLEEYF
ncbi:glutathione S-transferase T3-like [Raphanus sativus]|nr:glutathione S-transferase T3-like [Raphanus sativus]KAJ4869147.1 glutathione S-transferase T3-like [Raphanus sativus]